MPKAIKTATASISLIGKDIVRIRFKEGIEVSLAQTKANHKATRRLTRGRKHFVLFDMRGFVWGGHKATSFSASGATRSYRIAIAALFRSRALTLNYNKFIRFYKPAVPIRAFSDEKKALAWLKGFIPPRSA